MNICQFITLFPSWDNDEKIYGSTRAAYDLSLALAERGNKVIAFATSDTLYDKTEIYKNIEIHRYGSQFKMYSTRISMNIFHRPIKNDFDIVHVHFDIPPTPFAGLKIANKTKKPLVVTYHGDWDETYGGFFRKRVVSYFNRCFVDKLLTRADIIISPSYNYIQESRFLKKYADKVAVIPNGVDKKQFNKICSKEECRKILNLSIDKKIVLFLGALNLRKGPDILLNSMRNIINEYPDVKLIFVGEGNYKAELLFTTKNLGLENHVDFVGYVSEDLKPYYYKASDVFVVPSTISTDVFPLVLLEAMASGIPIVTSDLHTFKSIIEDGENGLISRKGDSQDLADKIKLILKNENIKSKLTQNGINYADKHSWDEIAKKTEAIYNNLLNNQLE